MKSLYMVKRSDIKMEYLETGEGNHVNLQDVIGKPEGAPFDFGMYEMEPSKGVDFEYDGDGAVCLGLVGTMLLTNPATGEQFRFEAGDIVYIPQEVGKHIIWSCNEYAKMAYVTYPHWR